MSEVDNSRTKECPRHYKDPIYSLAVFSQEEAEYIFYMEVHNRLGMIKYTKGSLKNDPGAISHLYTTWPCYSGRVRVLYMGTG